MRTSPFALLYPETPKNNARLSRLPLKPQGLG